MKRALAFYSFLLLAFALFAAMTLLAAHPSTFAHAAPDAATDVPVANANLSLGDEATSSEPATPQVDPVAPASSFRGLVALVPTSQDETCRVAAQDIDGATHMVLPAFANLAQLQVSLPAPYTTPVYLSKSATGPFAQGPFDVRTCKKNAQGVYTAYVRYSEGMRPFPVHIAQSAGVDAFFLTSTDPIKHGRAYVERSRDHSATVDGAYALVAQDGAMEHAGDLEVIRGRGNSSWTTPKRPYQIKLDKKASLIDGTPQNSAKTWVLISNQFDETMLRNYLAYKTALAVGLDDSADCKFVDLYYDGEYRGLYLLAEKVQFGGGRVAGTEVENYSNYGTPLANNGTAQAFNALGYAYQYVKGAVSPALPQQCSYLLELDASTYLTERCWFNTSAGPVVVKSPDDLSQAQMAYVSERVQRAINEASKPQGNLSAYFDVRSLAPTFLVNELAKNPDWLRYSSTFFSLNSADGKLHWGPVWDFDLAFGVHCPEEEGEYIDPAGWASQTSMFFGQNAQFKAAMRSSLVSELLPVARGLVGTAAHDGVPTVKEAAAQIAHAVTLDNMLWDTARAGSVSVFLGSFNKAVDYTHDWLTRRIDWLQQRGATFPQEGPRGTGLVRLAGANALSTMGAIVDYSGFAKGGLVVLTTSDGYWDALSAAGLAGLAQAPILMTSGKQLSTQTELQLRKLQPRTIVVCGGTAAISASVANQARAAAAQGARTSASQVAMVRCAGASATGTAVQVFKKAPSIVKSTRMTNGAWARTAFVCTNASYHDALAAAPISYATGMPIFLSEGAKSFSKETMDALRAGGIDAVYVVGGEAAISDKAVQQLQSAGITVAKRIFGETAIQTSEAVARFGLAKGMTANNMGVATSQGYWDSLSGAALCGKNNSVLVLASSKDSSSITGLIAQKSSAISRIFLFGGLAAIDKETADAVRKAAL